MKREESSSHKTAEDEIELVDLRERNDWGLARDVYDRLMIPTILLPEERQTFDLWRRRLAPQPPPPPEPFVTAVAAGVDLEEATRRRLAGYLIFEHYRDSRSLLMSYIGVDAAFRRRGLMRRMFRFGQDRVRASVSRAFEACEPDVRDRGKDEPIRATYAEIHVPGGIAPEHEPMETASRVKAFAALGAAVVPIHYIQPALEDGVSFGRNLMLLALPSSESREAPISIRRSALLDFLTDYYRSCGFRAPLEVPEFRAMASSVDAAAAAESSVSALRQGCGDLIPFVRIDPA